jgi:hypothetical protein
VPSRAREVVRVEARPAARSARVSRRRAHPVEPVRARAVDRPVPRVHAPERQLALDRVRLDERVVGPPRPPSGTRARRRVASPRPARACGRAPPRRSPRRLAAGASSNWPKVSSSLRRTRSSGVCASAAIVGRRTRSRAGSPRLERRQLRRLAEDVAVQLLVDADAPSSSSTSA